MISLALSAATAVLVLRSAPRAEGIVLGTLMLSLSWAVVTFSTSGLEGPLAHLLVVVVLPALALRKAASDPDRWRRSPGWRR